MKPLSFEVAANLSIQICKLLCFRTAELQRKNDNRIKAKSAKQDQRSGGTSLERDLVKWESKQLLRQIRRDTTTIRTQHTFILTLYFYNGGICTFSSIPKEEQKIKTKKF